MDTKVCAKCGAEKPVSEFQFRKDTNRHIALCKSCEKKRKQDYRQRNLEKVRAKEAAYRESNRELLRERGREFHSNNKDRRNKEKMDRYFANHNKELAKKKEIRGRPEEMVKQRKRWIRWASNNREYLRKIAYEWKKKNPEKVAASNKRDYEKNKERCLAGTKLARDRRRGAEGRYTIQDIKQRLDDQNEKCLYYTHDTDKCPGDISDCYTIEHIIPISRGGSNDPGNIALLCGHHNASKNNRTHEEYLKYLCKRDGYEFLVI